MCIKYHILVLQSKNQLSFVVKLKSLFIAKDFRYIKRNLTLTYKKYIISFCNLNNILAHQYEKKQFRNLLEGSFSIMKSLNKVSCNSIQQVFIGEIHFNFFIT